MIITGESGTGKELAARAIHDRSPRQNRPYVAINCAAVPESLIESELFGHERGAFTGADRRREGCFERANGGSLLLDEITEMRPEMQAKLLRVLEEKRILRLGASKDLPIDVRVFAASNRSLHQSIREGRLREDLYYRLNVYTVELPPLRDRLEDLPLLVAHFIREFNREHNKSVEGMGQDCLDALRAHAWPRKRSRVAQCRPTRGDQMPLSDALGWRSAGGVCADMPRKRSSRFCLAPQSTRSNAN